jgi:hypothetical protein
MRLICLPGLPSAAVFGFELFLLEHAGFPEVARDGAHEQIRLVDDRVRCLFGSLVLVRIDQDKALDIAVSTLQCRVDRLVPLVAIRRLRFAERPVEIVLEMFPNLGQAGFGQMPDQCIGRDGLIHESG